ncbi:MAG TPA: aminoglycoside phosphotransferase, partial [Halomonas sp.]|nr:aminoglycoside phosphotransferase [Halomonas sp.]
MEASLRHLLTTHDIAPTGELEPLSGGDSAAVYTLATRQGRV